MVRVRVSNSRFEAPSSFIFPDWLILGGIQSEHFLI